MQNCSRKAQARLNLLSRIRRIDREKRIVGLMAVVGSSLIAVGLIGSDFQQPQQVCYIHDLFVFCLQSTPEIVTVHETYWGLIGFGVFLLAVCGLWVFAGLRWPPRRTIKGKRVGQ